MIDAVEEAPSAEAAAAQVTMNAVEEAPSAEAAAAPVMMVAVEEAPSAEAAAAPVTMDAVEEAPSANAAASVMVDAVEVVPPTVTAAETFDISVSQTSKSISVEAAEEMVRGALAEASLAAASLQAEMITKFKSDLESATQVVRSAAAEKIKANEKAALDLVEGEIARWQSANEAELAHKSQCLLSVTALLNEKDACLAEREAQVEALSEKLAAVEATTSEKILTLEASHKIALDDAKKVKDEAVEKAKEKMKRSAEDQFARASNAYKALKRELEQTTATLNKATERHKAVAKAHADVKADLTFRCDKLDADLTAAQAELSALRAEVAGATVAKEEALAICEDAVRENDLAIASKVAAETARDEATADRDQAFKALARATQELAGKDAEVGRLKGELKDSTANCEELLLLCESLQGTN